MALSIPMAAATSTEALILLDKPGGITSFDAVRAVRRAVGGGTTKAGHTGTLDPMATGLLVILTGRGTRLISLVPGEPKVYSATIRFGEERDTDDVTGTVTRTAALPEPSLLGEAINSLTGSISQLPPAYSAKKVGGRRAYSIARAGGEPALSQARVEVHGWEVLSVEWPDLHVRITCGSGTYIRSLARDLGRLMHSAACLAELRRLAAGPFDVRDATTWQDLLDGNISPRPLVEALGSMPRQTLAESEVRLVSHGMDVPATVGGERAALLDANGDLVAVAESASGMWHPQIVLASA